MAERMMKKVKKAEGPQRAALYMRVSSGAQAKRDLSIPDQRRQLHDYCAAQGWTVTETSKTRGPGPMRGGPNFSG